MGTQRRRDRLDWSLTRRKRRGIIVAVVIGYVLIFPGTYRVIDHFYFILGILPIIAAGLLLGLRAAILTVFAISITHFGILAGPLGTPLTEAFVESVPFTTLVIGATIGYLRDMRVRLARDRAELQRRNDQLDEFASVVSHDLRNPLSVAIGRLEMAREDCDSDHLEAIADAHDRMAALIDNVLILAREGTEIGETEQVELAGITEPCWNNIVTNEASLVVETDRVIRADRTRLQQLLENLFVNAVEHGGANVTVTVGDIQDGFYIEDTGPGIRPGEREAVFEPGHSTESGSGLGLSIVHRIAEGHGWSVRVTEGSTGGARFEFTGVEAT